MTTKKQNQPVNVRYQGTLKSPDDRFATLRIFALDNKGELIFGGAMPAMQSIVIPVDHAITLQGGEGYGPKLRVPYGEYARQLCEFYAVVLIELAEIEPKFAELNADTTDEQDADPNFEDMRDDCGSGIYAEALVWQCAGGTKQANAVKQRVREVAKLYPMIEALLEPTIQVNDEWIVDNLDGCRWSGDVFSLEFDMKPSDPLHRRIVLEMEDLHPGVLQYLSEFDLEEDEDGEDE